MLSDFVVKMEQKPGFRFHPTDEELINDYLRNKILGKTWLVEDVINEINVYDHDPKSLPCKVTNFIHLQFLDSRLLILFCNQVGDVLVVLKMMFI